MKNTHFSFKILLPYVVAYAIPFLLLMFLLQFYNMGFGNPVPNTLDWTLIIWNGLASLCFYVFLKHAHNFSKLSLPIQLLFSFAYGLCSYSVLQEYAYNTLCIYALFPILYLFFEKTFCEKKYKWFIFLSALFMILDPQTSIPLFLLLIILYIIESKLNSTLSFGEFIHFISALFIAVLLAAFRLFPYIAQSAESSNYYKGFSFNYSPLTFISRLFPFGVPASAYFTSNGMDLYYGTAFLFLCILYFFNRNQSARAKMYYGIFLALTILAIEVSPVQHLFNLCSSVSKPTVSYAFLFVFWCMILALKTVPHIKDFRKAPFSVACVIYIVLLILNLLFNAHNYHIIAIQSLILFPLLTLITLAVLCFSKKESTICSQLLYCFVALELFCNIFISTNQNFIPATRNLTPQFALNKVSVSDDLGLTADLNPISSKDFNSFITEHTDKELYNTLTNLTYNIEFTEQDLDKYSSSLLPNNFEYINAICKKLGYTEDLFIPVDDISIVFFENDNYIITPVSNNIYNIEFRDYAQYTDTCIIPFTISVGDIASKDIHFYNDYSEQLLSLNSRELNEQATFYISVYPQQYFTINMQMLFYYINPDVYDTLDTAYANYLQDNTVDTSGIGWADYAGLVASFIGIIVVFLLYFNSDREKIYKLLLSLKSKLNTKCHFSVLTSHIHDNYVYYLSFFIPVALFVVTMVIYDCVPFGPNSFFDEDGLCLTLPSFLDTYYNLEKGNTYVSLNGGYGFSLYATNPLISASRYLLLLSPAQIAPFLLFAEAICLGICGFTMVFYLTHRLNGVRAYKKDYRLLVPSMIYALNTYMLAMHGFTGWYYTLLALPLLLLATDYLIYRKKTLPYVLLLVYCMITNLYLALYICIFLVINFFTYRFKNLKDFLCKGIRFALASLLAAVNSLFVISNTLLATYDSPYQEKDSIFPSLGFHTSFWKQWQNHMIFSESVAVTENDGYVSIYCGILTLILVVIFITSNKLSKSEKAKKIIPLMIMYLSFNGKVLSYIWNGFHYQSKVPNRYAFLLIFLLAVFAYDGLRLLSRTRTIQYLFISAGFIVFFSICQFATEGNTTLAYAGTLVLIILYAFIYMLSKHMLTKRSYSRIITGILLVELAANMIFTTGNYSLNSIYLYGDYISESNFIQDKLGAKNEFFRLSYPSSGVINSGQVYNVASNSLFNSFVSQHQVNCNYIFGFYYGTNNISSNHSSTPVGQSLTATKYIYLPAMANMPIHDLGQYNYIGNSNDYYVFENPDALSLGYFVPYDIDYITPTISFPPNFYNALASLYLTDNTEQLFDVYYLKYSDQLTDNSFAFSTATKEFIDFDSANAIYQDERKRANCNPLNALRMHLNITPPKSGEAYLYSFEFVSLGQMEENISKEIEIAYPNPISEFRDAYNYVILNKDIKDKFISAVRQHELENVTICNNSVTGTTNYDEDGYTMLSLACDRNWHAYIDGEEVEIIDNFGSFMLIETPAGSHTLELKYVPYGMKVSKIITYICWFLTLTGYGIAFHFKRKKQNNK